MSDNITLNVLTTAGAKIATDEIDWVQHQLVKLEFGENGSATMVSASNPLPVSASIDTVGLATSTGQASQATAVKQDVLLSELQLKANLTETQPVSIITLPLPTGAATAENQQTNALTDIQLRALAIATKEQPDATATYSPNSSTSVAYEASRVAKESAGTLYSVTGYNSKASSQFIQIHNSATLPIDTAIPVVLLIVPPYSNFSYSADKFGRFFSNGITICNSSTGATKTIGLEDIWFDIQYF